MGQVLHGSATTTRAVRAAMQRSKAPVAEIAEKQGVNRKTVMKRRATVEDAAMDPKAPRSTVLTKEAAAPSPSAAIRCSRSTTASTRSRPRSRT